MNKTEFVTAVADKAGLSKKDAAAAVDAVISTLTEQMAAGESVAFVGFGTFGAKDVPQRDARNPRDGSTITIPAHKSPYFKAGKSLKDSVK